MIVTIILLGGFISLLIYYYLTLKSSYEYFKQRNIPGPPPKLFFGNYLSIWSTSLFAREIPEWTREYGPIYGIFQGTCPIYVVSDVDFLQEVYIKQFSIFHSRPFNILFQMGQIVVPNLFSSLGNEWRRQRHGINLIFTTTKLKMMTRVVHKCVDSMMKKIDENKQNDFNIYALYDRLIMDIICHCAFGIDTDMQNDIDNMYMKKTGLIFSVDSEKNFLVRLTNLMPFLSLLLTKLMNISVKLINIIPTTIPSLMKIVEGNPLVWLFKQTDNVVKQRLSSGNKRSDLLQFMLDISTQEQIKDDDNEELISKQLQYKEVLTNTVTFLTASYTTLAVHLVHATYELVKHPDIQLKLQNEIDEHWKDYDQEQIDYDIINDMKYLDIFIKEVLRMHAHTNRVPGRVCYQPTTIYGHYIEKDTIIQPDIYSIHRSVDLWGPEDPNEFIPERHLTKRHPVALMAFGVGPRNCVGMGFAFMILKVALANILHECNILPGEKIEEGMKQQETITLNPEALYIKVEKRSK